MIFHYQVALRCEFGKKLVVYDITYTEHDHPRTYGTAVDAAINYAQLDGLTIDSVTAVILNQKPEG